MIGPASVVSPANGTSQNISTTLLTNKRSSTVSLIHIILKIIQIMLDVNFMHQDKKQGNILNRASMESSLYWA